MNQPPQIVEEAGWLSLVQLKLVQRGKQTIMIVYDSVLDCKDSLTNHNNPGVLDNYITTSPSSDERGNAYTDWLKKKFLELPNKTEMEGILAHTVNMESPLEKSLEVCKVALILGVTEQETKEICRLVEIDEENFLRAWLPVSQQGFTAEGFEEAINTAEFMISASYPGGEDKHPSLLGETEFIEILRSLVSQMPQADYNLWSKRLYNWIGETMDWKAAEKQINAIYWEWRNAQKAGQSQRVSSQEVDVDLLKLEIKAYLQGDDPFEKVKRKSDICSRFQVNKKDFDLLCQTLEQQSATPKQTVFSFDEFLEQGTEAIEWIIPGMLPKGEMALLVARAKVGKTLLATDITHAVLAGGQVIGEKVGVKGNVLLISSDESPNSTRRRLKARGFDLLNESAHNLRVMTHLDIANLSPLEQQLEDFRPDLVVIDSLTSITRDSGLSEKDAEFARPIYKLKDLLGRYGAASILIHHENKDKDAKSIDKVSGSARIVAAVWGIWQLKSANPNDDKCNERWLNVVPRESEPIKIQIELNPKDLWASQGIFNFLGEFGDETGQKRTQSDRVLDLLRKYSPNGLKYKEIDQHLNIGRSLYTILDRLESRQQIGKRKSTTDKRRWVYYIPNNQNLDGTNAAQHTSNNKPTSCSTDDNILQKKLVTPPPPTLSPSPVEQCAESIDKQGLEVIQQKVNTYSTVIQHPKNVDYPTNGSNLETAMDVSVAENSQQKTRNEGGRGSNSETVLQNDVPIAPDPETSNTDVVKDVTKFKSGDRVIVHYPAVQSFHQETGIVDSVKTDGQVGIIFANGTRCPFDPENLSLAPETEP